jgi:sarcosine oxidase/L-pipecolate oxidase
MLAECGIADYADPIYARLAMEAQTKIENDSDLKPHFFKQGISFVCDGLPSRFTETWRTQMALAKSRHTDGSIEESNTSEEVFQRIHGPGVSPESEETLGHKRRWNLGYCNLNDAFIDATESIRIYYNRCLAQASITFQCGSPVDRIDSHNGVATGVVLDDGRSFAAEKILVAAGAWSPKLVYLEGRSTSLAHEVVWIKVTDEEATQWKNMSVTTNLSTGLNVFPPYNGEVKVLRRSPGFYNTVSVPHPEDPSRMIEVSLPRTTVTNPTDVIPAEAEASLREDLREIMPPLANRPFHRTRLCW